MTNKGINPHLRAVGAAAMSAVPLLGGPIATLIQEYIPTTLQKRQAEVLDSLALEFQRLERRIDAEKFKSESFNLTFIKTVKLMLVELNHEKMEAFKAIILNDAISSNDDFEKEYFVGITDTLTGNHIRLLKILENPRKFVEATPELKKTMELFIRGSMSLLVSPLMRPLTRDHIVSILDDLHQKGLSIVSRDGYGVMLSKGDILKKSTTEIGDRYIKYITVPE